LKSRLLTTFALLLALLLTGNCASSSIFAAPSTQTTTFNFAGAAQTFTVPAGVDSITVTATGGEGGAAFASGGVANAVGGLGGQVTGTISVIAGEILQINVGVQVEMHQLSERVVPAAVRPIFAGVHLRLQTD